MQETNILLLDFVKEMSVLGRYLVLSWRLLG